ncbi:hypothetical protein FQN50_007294 [Emmonsiellopsis sp. PD_5]|nr:hypothetical protein FQN50_007294 [Emmonsiellopsis sp. PD_5]
MEALSQALQELPPSSVLDSKGLVQDFHQFFLRGTSEQCWKFIPEQYRSSNANIFLSRPSEFLSTAPTPPPTQHASLNSPAQSRLPLALPTSQRPKDPLPCPSILFNPYGYSASSQNRDKALPLHNATDCAEVNSCKAPLRPDNLPQPEGHHLSKKRRGAETKSTKAPAIRRRQCTEENQKWDILRQAFKHGPFPITSCEKVWASSGNLIDWSLPPGERQYKILKGIQTRKTESTFANRLNLIYVTHKVDATASKVRGGERGVGRKTRAFKMVAEEFRCDLEEVIRLDKRGRSYIKLMEEGGPAVILELAESVSSMCEDHLTDTERQLFTSWLNTHYSGKERISKCNEAAKIISEGLQITQGLELKDSQSCLLDILRKYERQPENSTQLSEPSSPVAPLPTDKPQQDISQLNTDERARKEHPDASDKISSLFSNGESVAQNDTACTVRQRKCHSQRGQPCPQVAVNANDHSNPAENTNISSHAPNPCSYPIVDAHMPQSTVFAHNSVQQTRNVNMTNDTVGIPSQSQEMNRLVSLANAAGKISHFEDQRPRGHRDYSFASFEPHNCNMEQSMEGQLFQDSGVQQPMTSQVPMVDTTYFSQSMEGQMFQDSGVQQPIASQVPIVDTTRYSQSMEEQMFQDSGVQQPMASQVPMVDTTRYSQSMEEQMLQDSGVEQLMESRVYSHNIQHSIPQSTNTSLHPLYIQEADGPYTQFSSFHQPVQS